MINVCKKRKPKVLEPKDMKTILGIDVSTKTGWAAIRCGTEHLADAKVGTLKFPPAGGFKRHKIFYQEMVRLINETNPQLVVLEGYAHAGKFNNTLQPELGGLVRLAVQQSEAFGIQVAPAALKKFVTGKGNAKKDLMMKEVYKRWRAEGTDDEMDAFALAQFGRALYYPNDIGVPKKNMEAVEDWKKNNAKLGVKKFLY
jgi:crossover junction endodeoxyribonuclease RuvC